MLAPNTDIETVLQLNGTGGTSRRLGRWLLWLGLLALIAAGAFWWWSANQTASAVHYQTVAAKRGSLTVTVSATGTVEPIEKVEVGSELSGRIRTVNVDYNDPVSAGEVLAEIDTDRLVAELNRSRALLDAARAGVEERQAALVQAESQLARIRTLVGRDFATRQDLDTAQATRDQGAAAVSSAKAQVEVAAADLAADETERAKAMIRSPIGGIVLSRNVDPGQTVAASLQAPVLFTIADDLARMQLLVDVDEADAGSVEAGQHATFTVEAFPDRRFEAKVLQLRYASESASGVVTYKSVLSVDNSSLALRPGMTAEAEIAVNQIADKILIPNAALRYAPPEQPAASDDRNWFLRMMRRPGSNARTDTLGTAPANRKRVFVLQDGQPEAISVTVGASDGNWTQLVGGDIHDGDALVVGSSGGT